MTSFLFQQNLRIGFLFHRLANLLLQELEDDIENRNNKKQCQCSNSHINPEKPDVPLNKNDAFQKVQKRHVQEKR